MDSLKNTDDRSSWRELAEELASLARAINESSQDAEGSGYDVAKTLQQIHQWQGSLLDCAEKARGYAEMPLGLLSSFRRASVWNACRETIKNFDMSHDDNFDWTRQAATIREKLEALHERLRHLKNAR